MEVIVWDYFVWVENVVFLYNKNIWFWCKMLMVNKVNIKGVKIVVVVVIIIGGV